MSQYRVIRTSSAGFRLSKLMMPLGRSILAYDKDPSLTMSSDVTAEDKQGGSWSLRGKSERVRPAGRRACGAASGEGARYVL